MYYNKFIRLRWNELLLIYLSIDFIVEIQSSSLSVFSLNKDRVDRLEFIKSLSDDGWSNRDICNYFNNNNILTPKGRVYTPQNIWMTLKKYQKRLDRESDYKIVDIKEEVSLISLNKPPFYKGSEK